MDERLPLYSCHKWVRAGKIRSVTPDPTPNANDLISWADLDVEGVIIRVDYEFMDKHNPQPGTWYVTYADGYASISPAKAFEEGYKLVGDEQQLALRALHAGAFTQRAGYQPYASHYHLDDTAYLADGTAVKISGVLFSEGKVHYHLEGSIKAWDSCDLFDGPPAQQSNLFTQRVEA